MNTSFETRARTSCLDSFQIKDVYQKILSTVRRHVSAQTGPRPERRQPPSAVATEQSVPWEFFAIGTNHPQRGEATVVPRGGLEPPCGYPPVDLRSQGCRMARRVTRRSRGYRDRSTGLFQGVGAHSRTARDCSTASNSSDKNSDKSFSEILFSTHLFSGRKDNLNANSGKNGHAYACLEKLSPLGPKAAPPARYPRGRFL